MTPQQCELIPTDLLTPNKRGCRDLLAWLAARGWAMSLLEVEQERLRRGLRAPRRKAGEGVGQGPLDPQPRGNRGTSAVPIPGPEPIGPTTVRRPADGR